MRPTSGISRAPRNSSGPYSSPTQPHPNTKIRRNIQLVFESMKVYTMSVTSEKRMLRQVAFTENVITTSLSKSQLLEQHFVLDSNEKKVKAGKSSREG